MNNNQDIYYSENNDQQEIYRLRTKVIDARNDLILERISPGGVPIVPLTLDKLQPIIIDESSENSGVLITLSILPNGNWGINLNEYITQTEDNPIPDNFLLDFALINDQIYRDLYLELLKKLEEARDDKEHEQRLLSGFEENSYNYLDGREKDLLEILFNKLYMLRIDDKLALI